MEAADAKSSLRIARRSLSVLYFNYGFITACWLGSIPSFRLAFHLNTSQLGLTIFCLGAASLVMAKPGGYLVAKFGPRKVVWFAGTSSALYSCILPYISLHVGHFPIYPLILVYSVLGTGYSIAFSTKAVEMEQRWQQPIMSSFHAYWSIGAFAGSLFYSMLFGPCHMDWFSAFPLVCAISIVVTSCGAYFLDADIDVHNTLGLLTDTSGTNALAPSPLCLSQHLLSPRYSTDTTPINPLLSPTANWILSPRIISSGSHQGIATPSHMIGHSDAISKPSQKVELKVYLFGLLGALAYLTEGSIGDWSGLFILEYDKGTTMSMVPLTYAAYSGLMTVSRLCGDYLALKLSRQTVCELGSSLALVGLLIFLGLPYWPLSLLGCGFIGLGLANNVPVFQSSLGQLESSKDPQMRPHNLALFSVLCQLGLLSGPAVLAPIAYHFGLKYAFLIPLIAVTIIGLVAPRLIKSDDQTISD